MKFISSFYDNESGESTVILQHLGKKFVGHSKIHPDEFDKRSEFAGCSYADMRASIQGLKYERRLLKEEVNTIDKFIKACECYNNFDPESPTAKVLYRQRNQKNKRIEKINEHIAWIERILKDRIINRDKFLKKVEEKKTLSNEEN